MTWNLVSLGRVDAVRRAAESLWAQDYVSVEHIIQDGGSTDGTVEILRDIASEAPDHIETKVESVGDTGIYDGMNRAVARASGRYIIFLNSDDLMGGPKALSHLAAPLEAHDLDFVFGQTISVDHEMGAEKLLGRPSLKSVLQRVPFGHNSAAFSREMFNALGGHDLRYRTTSDYDFILRMVVAGYQGAFVKQVTSKFFSGGASSNTAAVRADHAAIWGDILGNLVDLSDFDQAARERWFDAGHMPFRVAFAIWRKKGIPQTLRRAAWHSMVKSLRRAATGRGRLS
ncbi:glycosyltransferase [Litoreibacter ponti]|uniref:glycosyltransferase n=1 Tax=Litoreibacter ponti TaxID=1510457 RepID=UPI001304C56C|nr:glycosyltransferase [Litoreibacter ponti]